MPMKYDPDSEYDLGAYFRGFREAVEAKYGRSFTTEQDKIEKQYSAVRSGRRSLTIDDVMDLFDPGLPFVQDWTKPDRNELARKMQNSRDNVANLIDELRGGGYDLSLITKIRDCFRELSLTALVLHHVYPDRFAIISHHLAGLLHISGPTVPEFYIEYCKELRTWSERQWRTPGIKSVADAEFALWTWYRCAYSGNIDASEHEIRFSQDRWVQEQRAARIASSLGRIAKLDLARSYLDTDPTVAAMIALRELEITIRHILGNRADKNTKFHPLIDKLPSASLTIAFDRERLHALRRQRNDVIHGHEIEKSESVSILETVTEFIAENHALSKNQSIQVHP
jgi:hypothetical protein